MYKGEQFAGRVFKNYHTIKVDPDRESLSTPKLRERAKDLFRNNLISHGIVDTMSKGVIGSGLKLQSKIDFKFLGIPDQEARETSGYIERLWTFYSKRFDFFHNQSISQIAKTFYISYLNDGDLFYSILWEKNGLKIKGLDADFVESDTYSDNIFSGIEVDKNKRPHKIHYYDLEDNQKKYKSVNIYRKDGNRNIHHVFVPYRSGQLRGIPLISPVLYTLKAVDQFLDNELASSIIASLFSVFIKTKEQEMSDVSDDDDGERKELNLGAGTVAELSEGEDITIAESKRPAPSFGDFIGEITKLISSCVGLPPEVLLKSYNSNYSASRAAILDAWLLYEQERSFFVDNFYQKVYSEFIEYLVLSNKIQLKGYMDNPLIREAWEKSNWVGSARPHIDPEKEAKAIKILADNNFKTKRKIVEEREAEDYEEVLNQRGQEVAREKQLNIFNLENSQSENDVEVD